MPSKGITYYHMGRPSIDQTPSGHTQGSIIMYHTLTMPSAYPHKFNTKETGQEM